MIILKSGHQGHRKFSCNGKVDLSMGVVKSVYFFLSSESFHMSAVLLFESKIFDCHLCSSLKLNWELCGRLAGLHNGLFWHWQSIAVGENLQLLCSMVVKVKFSVRLGRGFRAICYQFPKKLRPSLFIPRRQAHWSDCLRNYNYYSFIWKRLFFSFFSSFFFLVMVQKHMYFS